MLFEQKKVRSHFDAEQEIWYFSVIDVIEILTGSTIPKRYWTDLKKKLMILTKRGYLPLLSCHTLSDPEGS